MQRLLKDWQSKIRCELSSVSSVSKRQNWTNPNCFPKG